ncbi:DUF1254 domain-containing protein [Sphingobium sp. AP49]|uniref:DUF1254 domain-containing protein n=1 Tax=Sphingobium sp. AP49 TaxID=1144307 RepID=UPI00026ED7A1|nr:DUF1254 domain-containing protein [Sphingobium sp. AP49]WHO39399.1 DUF1254 domain-containing protein [Sphingobium sp. AP49]
MTDTQALEQQAPSLAAENGGSTASLSGVDYTFDGGWPTGDTAQRAYDDLDLVRALQMYRTFYPTVSCWAMFHGNAEIGVFPNRTWGSMSTLPRHVGFTLNSDTPYGGFLLDLSIGPIVIELPPGPLLGAGMDLNQRWVADLGLPGPDAGKGGKHLFVPPGYQGEIPDGYYLCHSTTFKVLTGVRAIPEHGDLDGAVARLRSVNVHPLEPAAVWEGLKWIDMSPDPQDTTPLKVEDTLDYWRALHEVVDSEPPFEGYREHYGELATLGIAKGQPFAPDERMRGILEKAARLGCQQMRVQSFADRRPDRVVWPDRQWQWAGLRYENGSFDTENYTDTYAREKWFFQAIATSPAMFRRDTQAGSLYWLGLRDASGAYLEGSKSYRLKVPLPVPARLFWSVTVYDTETRSQIDTEQGKAALRSLFELGDLPGDAAELFFSPEPPEGDAAKRWIQTIPGKGWFVYFRIYGPEGPAFDGSWKPGDFEISD